MFVFQKLSSDFLQDGSDFAHGGELIVYRGVWCGDIYIRHFDIQANLELKRGSLRLEKKTMSKMNYFMI